MHFKTPRRFDAFIKVDEELFFQQTLDTCSRAYTLDVWHITPLISSSIFQLFSR